MTTIHPRDICTTDYKSMNETLMTIRNDDAYLIRETKGPMGITQEFPSDPKVEVFVRENGEWVQCTPELTDWVWKLYNDFNAADVPF